MRLEILVMRRVRAEQASCLERYNKNRLYRATERVFA